jgi:hypothetical protein
LHNSSPAKRRGDDNARASLGRVRACRQHEMSERALPEAVLPPGQRTTGFVYFPRIPDDKLELTTMLVDPMTAEQIGTIRMAFEKD